MKKQQYKDILEAVVKNRSVPCKLKQSTPPQFFFLKNFLDIRIVMYRFFNQKRLSFFCLPNKQIYVQSQEIENKEKGKRHVQI